ncbi:hypothetical protein, partial [Psychrobacter arcticus]|uniref:hypothetical protein n=1 Tax=Psychrobacter arcticus TaxID=334543 RepID=UPI001D1046F7
RRHSKQEKFAPVVPVVSILLFTDYSEIQRRVVSYSSKSDNEAHFLQSAQQSRHKKTATFR